MSEVTRNFIKAAMVYLALGVTIGLIMGVGYNQFWMGRLIPVHAHINLLGWVSMLMFGVAYHTIPRFHGRMLHSDKLAVIHFWLANIGVVGLSFGLYFKSVPLLAVFGISWAMAAYIFVYNLWKTMGGAAPTAVGR